MDQAATDFLNEFTRGERKLTLPAELPVIIENRPATLALHSILRLLPRKRVVLKGAIQDKIVVIKLFAKSLSSARNIAREMSGYKVVHEAHVVSPELIGHFISPDKKFEGLVYEYIDDATELGKCWPQLDDNQKRNWLREVMNASLLLHRAGAYQEDIHLGNFLLKDARLFLLDMGSIVIHEAPLSQPYCLFNLGQLIAQLDVREQPLADTAIDIYIARSGWIDSAPLRSDLHRAVRRAWRARLRDYLHKAKRICSLTFFEHTFTRLIAHRRGWESDQLQNFLHNPDDFIAHSQLLKAGNTATVVKSEINGRPVVIKRYNIKNWRHAISRCLRPTRAQHSWQYAHMLELMGTPSLKPVALLERRCGPLRGTAYFVCEWIDAPDLLSLGADYQLSDSNVQALQSLLSQMQKCRISHGDFKANNLLVDGDHIALIDLDAMQRHRSARGFARALRRDIERLLRNWPQGSAMYTQVAAITHDIVENISASAIVAPTSNLSHIR